MSEDENDEENEELMLDAAVRMSLQTTRTNGASTSSGRVAGPSPAAMRAAAAAERRLARQRKDIDVDDEQEGLEYQGSDSEASEDDFEGESSEDEPLTSTKIAPAKGGKIPAAVKRSMTVSEMNRARKEQRKLDLSARRANKKDERELMAKLGRRLTHVCPGLIHLVRHSVAHSISGREDIPQPAETSSRTSRRLG